MGPNILFSAIWRDRGGVQIFQKACFVEIKENSPHTSLKKLSLSNKIDRTDLGMIYAYIFEYSYHIIYVFSKYFYKLCFM